MGHQLTNIPDNVFSGETPFHPRRSGGTQEENGNCGAQEEEGMLAYDPVFLVERDQQGHICVGDRGWGMRCG